MNFSRIQALIFFSLLGFSGAHRVIRPRALASTQPGPTDRPQSNTKSNPRVNTVKTVSNNSTITNSTGNTVSSPPSFIPYQPDHPDWEYLNGIAWWKIDLTQQDHVRFHMYLSMAAYGNYSTLCPSTFTKGFTVLETFNTEAGQAGFVALIPEMDKVVIVFRGSDNFSGVDWSRASIEDLVSDCQGCEVAAGIKKLYLSAKLATNNWAVAIKKVAETGLKFSVTGHGVGGAVAALAGLDLGAQGLVHYSHNQGMPRAMNVQAIIKYDNVFQALAGQSAVSKNDFMVQAIQPGPFYHIGQKLLISGNMQQWLTNCYGNNENTTCTGNGQDYEIHNLYMTSKGQCGSPNKGW